MRGHLGGSYDVQQWLAKHVLQSRSPQSRQRLQARYVGLVISSHTEQQLALLSGIVKADRDEEGVVVLGSSQSLR